MHGIIELITSIIKRKCPEEDEKLIKKGIINFIKRASQHFRREQTDADA